MTTSTDRPQFTAPSHSIREVDYGFFGPDSPTWKVWSSPTALIAFQRAVTLEHFDPALTASVADIGGIYSDPRGRLDHTLAYFLIVAVGDSRMAITASDHLMQVHAQSTGIDPITGDRYSANNPASQLWIHVTGWHSALKAYEVYGPGPLDPEQEQRYWDDCVIAAELQTCKQELVPRNREEVREYFAQIRPSLCVTERAREGMHYLLYTPRDRGLRLWASSRAMAPAAIATLPQWMRTLGGYDQPALLDGAARIATRTTLGALRQRPELFPTLLQTLGVPTTARLLRQHLDAGAPDEPVTVSVADARRRYGRTAETAAAPVTSPA